MPLWSNRTRSIGTFLLSLYRDSPVKQHRRSRAQARSHGILNVLNAQLRAWWEAYALWSPIAASVAVASWERWINVREVAGGPFAGPPETDSWKVQR